MSKKIQSILAKIKSRGNAEPPVKYATGIEWIDNVFEGGFEKGQLIAILGDAEAGKTRLLDQILTRYGKAGMKSMYFALEFNERKLLDRFQQKLINGTVTEESIGNIYAVTTDMIETDVDTIVKTIELNVKAHKIEIVAIDSTMMLYVEGSKGEAMITEIFRKMHNIANSLDILLFVVTQASKEDIKGNRISILGSQRANHFCDIILFLQAERDDETNEIKERYFIIHKNKQNGEYAKKRVFINPKTLEFEEARVGINPEYGKQSSSAAISPYDVI